jgi:hypothetical protein
VAVRQVLIVAAHQTKLVVLVEALVTVMLLVQVLLDKDMVVVPLDLVGAEVAVAAQVVRAAMHLLLVVEKVVQVELDKHQHYLVLLLVTPEVAAVADKVQVMVA